MTYALGGSLDAASVGPGTNVLVAGPPLTGKRQLARDVLRRGTASGEGAIYVTLRDPAERVRALFEDEGDGSADALGIVDCVTEHVGESPTETDLVRYASSPTDMTGIGIKFAEFVEYFQCDRERNRNRVVVDSVTTLLQYSSLQTVFRFLHAVTTRVTEVDAVGCYLVDSTVHDEETLATIRELFDGVVETRRDGEPTVDIPRLDEAPERAES